MFVEWLQCAEEDKSSFGSRVSFAIEQPRGLSARQIAVWQKCQAELQDAVETARLVNYRVRASIAPVAHDRPESREYVEKEQAQALQAKALAQRRVDELSDKLCSLAEVEGNADEGDEALQAAIAQSLADVPDALVGEAVGGTVEGAPAKTDSPNGGLVASAVVLSDANKGKFALKDKDAAMAAFAHLRELGGFPDNDDDEIVFSDDDSLIEEEDLLALERSLAQNWAPPPSQAKPCPPAVSFRVITLMPCQRNMIAMALATASRWASIRNWGSSDTVVTMVKNNAWQKCQAELQDAVKTARLANYRVRASIAPAPHDRPREYVEKEQAQALDAKAQAQRRVDELADKLRSLTMLREKARSSGNKKADDASEVKAWRKHWSTSIPKTVLTLGPVSWWASMDEEPTMLSAAAAPDDGKVQQEPRAEHLKVSDSRCVRADEASAGPALPPMSPICYCYLASQVESAKVLVDVSSANVQIVSSSKSRTRTGVVSTEGGRVLRSEKARGKQRVAAY